MNDQLDISEIFFKGLKTQIKKSLTEALPMSAHKYVFIENH